MPTEFRLAELLVQKDRTQVWLALVSGVALRTISRLCRNETAQVSLATLDKIATALGVEPGELVGRQPKRRR